MTDVPNLVPVWRYGFRHLSPSIVPKRNNLAVDLTVWLLHPEEMAHGFRCLQLQETIEWE